MDIGPIRLGRADAIELGVATLGLLGTDYIQKVGTKVSDVLGMDTPMQVNLINAGVAELANGFINKTYAATPTKNLVAGITPQHLSLLFTVSAADFTSDVVQETVPQLQTAGTGNVVVKSTAQKVSNQPAVEREKEKEINIAGARR